MKKLNKRLIISLVALVVSISLATTATYAWFSMNTEPSVEQFDLKVTSEDGLYISVDGTNYFNDLTLAQIMAANPLYNVRLKPLSTGAANQNAPGAATFTNGVPALTTMAGAAIGAADANSYYTFTLSFRSASPYQIYLADLNMAALKSDDRPTYHAWEALNATTLAAEEDGALVAQANIPTTNAAEAARIAFGNGNSGKIFDPVNAVYADTETINEAAHNFYKHNTGSNVTDYTEATDVISGAATTPHYTRVTMVEVDDADAFRDGTPVMNLYKTTDSPVTATSVYTLVSTPVAGDATHYYAPATWNASTDAPNSSLETAGKALYTSTDGNAYTLLPENGYIDTQEDAVGFYVRDDELLNLTHNETTGFYEGSLVVTIWIEGTDANCFEYILADILQTSMSFSGQVGRSDYVDNPIVP